MTDIDALIAHLKTIPKGQATTAGIYSTEVFDIGAGRIGLASGHEEYFLECLSGPMSSLVVRVFDHENRVTIPHGVTGEPFSIPTKDVYGYLLSNGVVEGLSAEEIKTAHSIDAKTGNPAPPEPGVRFVDAPDILMSPTEEPSVF